MSTDATIRTDLRIDGMTCAACSSRIQRRLEKLEAVVDAQVNFANGRARINHDASLGIDSLAAAKMVGEEGRVKGVDMTPAMLERARRAADEAQAKNVAFLEGHMEELPVEDGWADVVISNGVLNLAPDKSTALGEMARVLGPNGRLQIADILVSKAVPDGAKRKIDLWTV